MSAPHGVVCAQLQIHWPAGEQSAVATMQMGIWHCALQSAKIMRGSHWPAVRSTPPSIGACDDAHAARHKTSIARIPRTMAIVARAARARNV
jgi:hypothetical protein